MLQDWQNIYFYHLTHFSSFSNVFKILALLHFRYNKIAWKFYLCYYATAVLLHVLLLSTPFYLLPRTNLHSKSPPTPLFPNFPPLRTNPPTLNRLPRPLKSIRASKEHKHPPRGPFTLSSRLPGAAGVQASRRPPFASPNRYTSRWRKTRRGTRDLISQRLARTNSRAVFAFCFAMVR